jgi:multicomponent K+:H+ antiporter subunit A
MLVPLAPGVAGVQISGTPVDPLSLIGVTLLLAAGLLTVLWHRHPLKAVIALSVVGLLVSLAFVRFSAPDLALTQLSVEVVTIMLLLLALFFLPQRCAPESSSWRRARDLALSLATGCGVGLAAWGMLTGPHASISGFFMDQSLPGGGGKNVVNVILVDFRGFDTLGEITVLAVAAIGIFALLYNLRLPVPQADPDAVPEMRTESVTKPGDVWVLGRHRLMCGDSTDAGSVALLMAGQEADACWTDPPYNVAYETKAGKIEGMK